MLGAFFYRWFPNEPPNYEGFHAEIRRLMPPAGKLLDLGCGPNGDLAYLRGHGHEVWGTDLHRHPALVHPQWFRLMPPTGAIPFDDASLDLVATFMVVEHVVDPEAFLREVVRVLRPGGHFIAHSISALHYVTWIRRMVGMLPHAWTQRLVRRLYGRAAHDTFPTYYRMNTPRRIARHARRFGLEMARIQRYADTDYFQFSARLSHGAVIADWLLEHILPGMGRIYFTATYRKLDTGESGMVQRGRKIKRAAWMGRG